jgi:hypothetical protein
MNKRVFYGQSDIRYYLYRFRESKYYSLSIFTSVILVCLLLLLGVIIPQVTNYLSIQKEAIERREKIRIINSNIEFMNSLDRRNLDEQLEVLTKALPLDKDFVGILNALSDASIKSGVTLSDFTFNVGEVSSKSAETEISPSAESHELLPEPQQPVDLQGNVKGYVISTVVVASGSMDRLSRFIKELGEKLPLSDVSKIDGRNNTTTIKIDFHYKPFPNINFQEDVPLQSLTDEDLQLIEELKVWRPSVQSDEIFVPIGTQSAVPLFQ